MGGEEEDLRRRNMEECGERERKMGRNWRNIKERNNDWHGKGVREIKEMYGLWEGEHGN